jgi:hypothetical protein
MNEQHPESLQTAQGLSRRASVLTIGATGLAALAAPLVVEARKKSGARRRTRSAPASKKSARHR